MTKRALRPLRCVVLTAVIAAALTGCAHGVAGTYETCMVACATWELRADRTFFYTPASCLGKVVIKGTWSLQPDGTILANSDQQPDKQPFSESLDPQQSGTVVHVRLGEVAFQGAEVTASFPFPVHDRSVETDENGDAFFTERGATHIRIVQPLGWSDRIYHLACPDDNVITTPIQGPPYFVVDETWLVSRGRLYILQMIPIPRVH